MLMSKLSGRKGENLLENLATCILLNIKKLGGVNFRVQLGLSFAFPFEKLRRPVAKFNGAHDAFMSQGHSCRKLYTCIAYCIRDYEHHVSFIILIPHAHLLLFHLPLDHSFAHAVIVHATTSFSRPDQ